MSETTEAGRVTGIGGFVFTCADPAAVREWYFRHLGMEWDDEGTVRFHLIDTEAHRPAVTLLRPVPEAPTALEPGRQPFMVRYRVDNLDALLARLDGLGETVIDPGRESDEGRLACVLDPDGQKVELWDPIPSGEAPAEPAGPVTGFGGVFFKSHDPAALKTWYRTRLLIEPDDAGYVVFSWQGPGGLTECLSWEVFAADTDYFDPGTRPYMFNFRVDNLDNLRGRLLEDGSVQVDPQVQEFEYGKFGWILDPTGARIELWEPNDRAFD